MVYIPSHLQIEPVNRYCDARCPMCTIKFVPDFKKNVKDELSNNGIARPAEIMSLETFRSIASKFKPYVKKIRFLSLHGCGEPLLDKKLHEKIKCAKDIGFKEVGFTSNCNILTETTSKNLLEAGLNCIIPSIDGLTKEVHEAIRPRTDYEKIVKNVSNFIKLRDQHNFNCKVLIRMVRQQLNTSQWDDYNTFWRKLLSAEKGDDVLGLDVHNTGGKVPNYNKMKVSNYNSMKEDHEAHHTRSVENGRFDKLFKPRDEKNNEVCVKASEVEELGGCPDLFTRLSIFVSGDVALCAADQAEYFKLGNVIHQDPIQIFNNKLFSHYRKKWLSNSYKELDHCKDCTVVTSRFHKTYVS
jgi:radical SAM protein with 4Fe4S-binding SPASM domain